MDVLMYVSHTLHSLAFHAFIIGDNLDLGHAKLMLILLAKNWVFKENKEGNISLPNMCQALKWLFHKHCLIQPL